MTSPVFPVDNAVHKLRLRWSRRDGRLRRAEELTTSTGSDREKIEHMDDDR